jgi:hypothetical protein
MFSLLSFMVNYMLENLSPDFQVIGLTLKYSSVLEIKNTAQVLNAMGNMLQKEFNFEYTDFQLFEGKLLLGLLVVGTDLRIDKDMLTKSISAYLGLNSINFSMQTPVCSMVGAIYQRDDVLKKKPTIGFLSIALSGAAPTFESTVIEGQIDQVIPDISSRVVVENEMLLSSSIFTTNNPDEALKGYTSKLESLLLGFYSKNSNMTMKYGYLFLTV